MAGWCTPVIGLPALGNPEGWRGERRSDRRSLLRAELAYRVIRHGRAIARGRGHTVNVSGGGILFESELHLPAGMRVELCVTWPARRNHTIRVELWAAGRIVRTQGNRTAVSIARQEFCVEKSNQCQCSFSTRRTQSQLRAWEPRWK